MRKLSNLPKTFLFITSIACCLWLGSYVLRMFISYQLFEAPDLSIKSYITSENIEGILFTLLPAFTTTFLLYTLFIPSFILFLVTSKISLKNNGWLFMICLIILITLPFEAYLMIIDYNIIMALISDTIDTSFVIANIRERFTVFSSFPLIEIFCFFAIIFLALFKPLTKEPVTK